jgi:hypothetical protein
LPGDALPALPHITAASSGLKPVLGEFLLMRQLAFGITRDNASASDNVSTPAVWIPDF